jgi:superfamily II DNA or RNA helicase
VFSPYRPDLTGVGSQAGDFSTSQLSKRMNQDKLVGDIVSEWKKRANGEPTVVHCVDSAHTIGVCEEFSGQGVNAEYILQDTSQDEREAIFSNLRDGKIQVVTNCQTLTRGWDEPCVSVCVLAKPTKRLRTYLQMVGRVLRSHPGKESAKLIDHSGAVFRHGWPTEDRDWSTEDGEAIEEAESKRTNIREPYCCPKCSALWSKGTECPNCGFKQIKRGQLAVNEAGELVKVKKKQIRKARDKNDPQVLWMKILAQSAYGRKPYRVAAARFKHTFGEWPENAGVGPNASFSQRNMLVRDLWPKFIRGKK